MRGRLRWVAAMDGPKFDDESLKTWLRNGTFSLQVFETESQKTYLDRF
jgi:hypothetical protein